jgi:nucleoside-diphosphate-sugar epimerase
MTILVTGATGKVGRHLMNALTKGQEKVRILIRNKMTEFENVEVFYGDINDRDSVRKAAESVDTIFHLAAEVDSSASEDMMYKVNVVGTSNILELSKTKKFIYLSTTSVLGKSVKEPIDESAPYKPQSFYDKTKMEAEKLVRGNGGMVLRSPDAFMPLFGGLDIMFSKVHDGTMPIIGDGKNFVDFIHINDLIDALMLVKERGRSGETYNVCGKDFKTQNEYLSIISKCMGVEPPKKHVSIISARISLIGNIFKKDEGKKFMAEYIDKIVRNRTYDLAKAKSDLGFEPKIDIETSIGELAEDFLERLKEKDEKVPEENSEEQG